MNREGEFPKFCRKNKKTQRELKHLNFDYYIKGTNPDVKTLASSKKLLSSRNSSEHRFASSSSGDRLKIFRQSQKDVSKTSREKTMISRTRSSTTLNGRKSELNK